MSLNALEFYRREDHCEYFLFPKLSGEAIPKENGDEEENNDKETEFLSILDEIKSIVTKYCDGYIWHKDEFNLSPRYKFNQLLREEDNKNNLETLPPHYHGITHYGENIQDEWFIVYLLLEFSKQIPGLVARIVDSDGEFLLIEAAEHLPKWANPETCEQRVYISNGEVILIKNSDPDNKSILPMVQGVQVAMSSTSAGENNEIITRFIADRIQGYPERIADDSYRTTLYVPLGVAKILKKRPSLISAACNAFYNRDMIDMKACKAMRYFPPENRVYTTAIFSKCLYAMVSHTKYVPDRKIGWNLPVANDPSFKSHELGMKIACGFEILASQAKPPPSLDDDKGWKLYMKSLENKNYFQDNLEGSKDYQRLLEGARNYYTENRESMNSAESTGQEILIILKEVETNVDDFAHEYSSNLVNDDDSWLNISPDELDEIMTKRYGVKKIFSINGNADVNLTENMNEFLEKKSEFDGIENDGPSSTQSNHNTLLKSPSKTEAANLHKLLNNTNGSSRSGDDDDKIDFDPDGFKMHVNKYLDLFIPEDNWESNSDMSDYEDDEDIGKKMESTSGSKKIDIKKYMKEMDLELSKTTIGKSFEKKKGRSKDDSFLAMEDDFDDVEDFTPVDIDKNMVKNMMEGYQSQVGGSGPISNLLSSMGVGFKMDDGDDSESAIEQKITQV